MKWLRMYLELKAVHRGSDSSTVTDRDVEVLYVQVNKFALVGINRCNKLHNVYKFALVGKQDLYEVNHFSTTTGLQCCDH